MAKGFPTVHLLQGKEPLLRQMVCEVRFRDGHLYLDRSGHLLRTLIQSSPDWVLGPQPNPNGTVAFNLAEGMALNFSMQGASLNFDKTATDEFIEPAEAQQFAQIADDTLGLVFDELEVMEWSRIGFRELYYFPCESKADTESWLTELKVFSVSPAFANSFKGTLDATGFSLVIEGEDCSFRIGLNGVERSAQIPVGDATLTVRPSGLHEKQKAALARTLKKKRQRQINAAFAAVLDIDAYRSDPSELNVGDFIRECTSNNLERFRNAIPAANGTKGK